MCVYQYQNVTEKTMEYEFIGIFVSSAKLVTLYMLFKQYI